MIEGVGIHQHVVQQPQIEPIPERPDRIGGERAEPDRQHRVGHRVHRQVVLAEQHRAVPSQHHAQVLQRGIHRGGSRRGEHDVDAVGGGDIPARHDLAEPTGAHLEGDSARLGLHTGQRTVAEAWRDQIAPGGQGSGGDVDHVIDIGIDLRQRNRRHHPTVGSSPDHPERRSRPRVAVDVHLQGVSREHIGFATPGRGQGDRHPPRGHHLEGGPGPRPDAGDDRRHRVPADGVVGVHVAAQQIVAVHEAGGLIQVVIGDGEVGGMGTPRVQGQIHRQREPAVHRLPGDHHRRPAGAGEEIVGGEGGFVRLRPPTRVGRRRKRRRAAVAAGGG